MSWSVGSSPATAVKSAGAPVDQLDMGQLDTGIGIAQPTPPRAVSAPRAPGLCESDLDWVRDLLRREAANAIDGKEYLIDSRLSSLARRFEFADAETLVAVARGGDHRVCVAIIEALLVNETSWFRDKTPFDALGATVLERLVRERATERRLRIWSAGCSSGQEAYSVAMLCRDVVPHGWTVDILGTDVSRRIVEQARSGRYSQLEVNRGLPATRLVKWLRRSGTEWEVVPELRAMVRWEALNVARPFASPGQFDVIFLRNVLIYFDVQTKIDVLDRMHATIRPDGYLILGGAETTLGVTDDWRRELVGAAPMWRPGPGPVPDQRTSAGTVPTNSTGGR